MVGSYYSGYLADDEDLQGAQRNKSSDKPTVPQVRNTYDRKALLKPPSLCRCRNPTVSSYITDVSAVSAFESDNQGEKKERHNAPFCNSQGAAQEFSKFLDFLVDMDALDNLQEIMKEAIQKISEVIMEDEEGLHDFKEDVSSSPESESCTFSCHKQCDCFSSSHSPSTSSSEEDCKECFKSKVGHQNKCMLDKFVARVPKKETRRTEEVARIVHAKSVTEKSANYYFHQEHFHVWAQLAESSVGLQEQDTSDVFSKIKKNDQSQLESKSSFDIKHIEKEITNVLKQPTPSDIPVYYPGQQPFKPLDLLEENKLFSSLQDIINQAILELLNATKKNGSPLYNVADDFGKSQPPGDNLNVTSLYEKSSSPGNIDESTQTVSENAEDGKIEEDETEEGKTREKRLKEASEKSKHRQRSIRKSKSKSPLEKPPSKPKYVPPPLPKSKPRAPADPPPPKPKYVPPPLPKSKPRPPVEKPPPKPKYVPPPLPKPKSKKPAVVEEELPFSQSTALPTHLFHRQIFKKDQADGHLKGKLYRRQEEIVEFLVENAARHVLYKYNYEKSLSEKLGFISVPVTKVLLEIMFGFKKLKGSSIRLSSQIDWADVYQQVYAKRLPKPQKLSSKGGNKKSAYSRPKLITGQLKLIEKPTEQNVTSLPEINEIVSLNFPDDIPRSGEDSQGQSSVMSLKQMSSSRNIVTDSQRKLSTILLDTEGQNSVESPRRSLSSRRASITSESNKKSLTILPDTEGQNSVELLWQASSSQRTSITEESNRKSSTTLPDTEGQNSVEFLWQASSSRRTSIMEETNRKSSTILPDTEGQNSVESLRQSSVSQRTSVTGESSQKSSTVLPKI